MKLGNIDFTKSYIIFIYVKNNNIVLDTLFNIKCTTNKTFYAMIKIVFIYKSSYILIFNKDNKVSKDNAKIKLGDYYMNGKSIIYVYL